MTPETPTDINDRTRAKTDGEITTEDRQQAVILKQDIFALIDKFFPGRQAIWRSRQIGPLPLPETSAEKSRRFARGELGRNEDVQGLSSFEIKQLVKADKRLTATIIMLCISISLGDGHFVSFDPGCIKTGNASIRIASENRFVNNLLV